MGLSGPFFPTEIRPSAVVVLAFPNIHQLAPLAPSLAASGGPSLSSGPKPSLAAPNKWRTLAAAPSRSFTAEIKASTRPRPRPVQGKHNGAWINWINAKRRLEGFAWLTRSTTTPKKQKQEFQKGSKRERTERAHQVPFWSQVGSQSLSLQAGSL